MTFFCISDEQSAWGFKLAGVETRTARTRSQALEALRVAQNMGTVGIVIITDTAAKLIRSELDAVMYNDTVPLILEVPSRGGSAAGIRVGEYLKKAIGITV